MVIYILELKGGLLLRINPLCSAVIARVLLRLIIKLFTYLALCVACSGKIAPTVFSYTVF